MKSYGFVLTDWNLNTAENYLKIMKEKNIRYIAYGLEYTQKGIAHHQAFLYFHNERSYSQKNLGQMGKWWGKKHCFIENMKGNFGENETYCSKEEIYTKLGDEPKQGFRGDLKETIRCLTKGEITPMDILMENPQTFNLYKKSFSIARNLFMMSQFRTKMTQGYWFYGGTDVGKSHSIFKNYNPVDYYLKDIRVKWWDNYQQNKIVCLNEFRGEIKYGEILDLVDKWPKNVPIRNEPSIPFTSEIVCITSPYHPEEVPKWKHQLDDTESIKQLLRRFKVIHLQEKSDADVVYW